MTAQTTFSVALPNETATAHLMADLALLIRPGDVITLQARALDKFIKRERLFVVHDNVFFNQHGEVICCGHGWTIRPQ